MEEQINDLTNFEKLIEQRKRKYKRKNILKLSLVGFVFLMLGIYLLTPLSQVRTLNVEGNLNFKESQILEISKLSRSSSLYFIKAKDIEARLNENPLIESSKVNISPLGVKVEIEELTPVLKYQNKNYLNNGELLDNALLENQSYSTYLNSIISKIPTLLSSEESLSKEKIKTFSKIYFSLTSEERTQIKCVRFFTSNPSKISFFYQDEKGMKEIVTEIPLNYPNVQDISKMFNQESLTRYQNEIFDNKQNMDKLTLQKYENENTSFEYYSIKVIMDIVPNDDPHYHVVPNNSSATEQ